MGNNQILMLGWEYPPHNSGGLGVACEGLTQALADGGTEICFTLPYEHPVDIDHMHVLSCYSRFVTLPFGKNSPPFQAYSTQASGTSKINFDPKNVRSMSFSELEYKVNAYANSILDAVRQEHIASDVIHAHDWMTYPAAQYLKKKLHKPFVAHVHSTEFDRVPTGNGNPFITHVEAEGLHNADRVIAVSELTKSVLMDKYGVAEDKIDVVHNGIDVAPKIQTLQFAQDRPVIVFMGRLTMQKGAEYFLQLAKKVLTRIPNALFVVAGHGDQYSMLLLENAKQKLSSSVIFAGFLRDQQKDFLLDRADVFVMPSISEPFGLVALEAVQRETPVIISKTSGVKEVLPGAIVFDFWDTDLMAESIEKLLRDPTYYEQVVDQQLASLGEVSWKKSAEKIKEVYQRILNRRK
ncbi:MAG: glycosyltransferase family 4 protein [Patescibacteria group bacterium]